jgi:hypothetical protein
MAPAFDVRAVALGTDQVFGVCGTNGQFVEFDLDTMSPQGSTPIPGYTNQAAKGTIELASGRGYLGAGDGGVQVRNGADGELLQAIANEDFRGGFAPAIVNAFSVQNSLGFVAAGAQGLQVVRLGRYRCDGRESEETAGLEVLGQLALEDGASCNMVMAKNHILVVAAGSGGVKLVEMDWHD